MSHTLVEGLVYEPGQTATIVVQRPRQFAIGSAIGLLGDRKLSVIMSKNRESWFGPGERIQAWNYPTGKYAIEL